VARESHATGGEQELMRSGDEEKDQQVTNVTALRGGSGIPAEYVNACPD